MEADELIALIRGTPGRFRSLRLAASHWVDRDRQFDGWAKYRSNPNVVNWYHDATRARWPTGLDEERWKVWAQFPSRIRVEWTGRDARTHLFIEDGSSDDHSVAQLTRPGTLATRAPVPEAEQWRVTLSRMNPVLGELLVPGETFLSIVVDGGIEDFPQPTLEVLGRSSHAGRGVIRVRLIVDWNLAEPTGDENLGVADDYEGLVDADTGIILRWACRRYGDEFWVVSIDEVAFDEPLDAELFQQQRP